MKNKKTRECSVCDTILVSGIPHYHVCDLCHYEYPDNKLIPYALYDKDIISNYICKGCFNKITKSKIKRRRIVIEK